MQCNVTGPPCRSVAITSHTARTMTGYITLSAVYDQATSLQAGQSVLVSKQRNLLHNFGTTSTYNERRHLGIPAAAAMADDKRGSAQFESTNGLA